MEKVGRGMPGNGLTDHELLMEVREDVGWIKNNLRQYPTRKEVIGIFTILLTLGLGIVAVMPW